jgi:hypothetical protein
MRERSTGIGVDDEGGSEEEEERTGSWFAPDRIDRTPETRDSLCDLVYGVGRAEVGGHRSELR